MNEAANEKDHKKTARSRNQSDCRIWMIPPARKLRKKIKQYNNQNKKNAKISIARNWLPVFLINKIQLWNQFKMYSERKGIDIKNDLSDKSIGKEWTYFSHLQF